MYTQATMMEAVAHQHIQDRIHDAEARRHAKAARPTRPADVKPAPPRRRAWRWNPFPRHATA